MKNDSYNLSDALNSLKSSDILPMHMPGHKRNPDYIDAPFAKDITEIDGFDDLHRATGLIKDINTDARNLWGADDAIISVNGSTGLLISVVMALSSLGTILIASNCHISVWHGLEIAKGKAVTLSPENTGLAFAGKMDPGLIDKTLTDNPDIKSIIITSPTYEGIISDIPAIKDVANKHNAILVVDEAHGAHLGLHDYFPATSIADIVVKSIHKTLSAPTQTAVMLFYGDKAPSRLVKHYKDSIESSSPSYVLMDGICSSLQIAKRKEAFEPWVKALKETRDKLGSLRNLILYPSDDPSKFVIISKVITGYTLADILRQKYQIELEASFPDYIIAMTGIGDNEASLDRFVRSLMDIDASISSNQAEVLSMPSLCYPSTIISGSDITKALTSPYKAIDASSINQHIGAKSATYLFAYPPGIPLLIPGQIITTEVASTIISCLESGLHLTCEPYNEANKLFLVDI